MTTALAAAPEASSLRRDLILGGAFLATSALALAATPHRLHEDFSGLNFPKVLPERVLGWTSEPSSADILPETAGGLAKAEETYSTTYVGEGLPSIMLLTAYHSPRNPDIKAHLPETCYTVAGFKVIDDRPVAVPAHAARPLPGRAFTGVREDRTEHVLYWTRVGERFATTMNQERLDVLLSSLKGVIADGLLMRLSILGGDGALATRWLQAFAGAMTGGLSEPGRRLFLGAA